MALKICLPGCENITVARVPHQLVWEQHWWHVFGSSFNDQLVDADKNAFGQQVGAAVMLAVLDTP